MDYILSGNSQEVENVIRENGIRIQRGVISITPLDCEVHTDNSDVIATLQERNAELNKMFANECKEHSAACERVNELQIKLTRLQEAGVDIDLILDASVKMADDKTDPEADTKELTKSDSKELIKADDKVVHSEPEADTEPAKPKAAKPKAAKPKAAKPKAAKPKRTKKTE